eukprot:TRINITY_DN5147_c0_g1_i1.p1 TRINITY_DN5147_c0_g1~~TRINITY_DN5147_c0_g1_i1.p1  ORF type:complete len:1219 (+),score=480.96 TRINITY_DN5147_c0_g1_i1:47-3703(+)
MHLYSLTLQQATAITQCAYGNFSAPGMHEIVVARGKVLELLRPDESFKIQSVYSTEIFGTVRSIHAFRLTGGNKDYLIVGSDSGRIVILDFNVAKNCFERVHCETFGKSGCRRIVPGQYLAVDPKGISFRIGAIEKQKLVYILNRDAAAKLTISSPLEAHKAHTLIHSIVGVDVEFENPIFACLEIDYSKLDNDGLDDDNDGEQISPESLQKNLTFYELDLGLNHVVRKWSDPCLRKSNLLISVPGGADGPGGVLVCAEDYIVFKNQNHPDISCRIPRRKSMDMESGVLITSYASHKQRDLFFFLVQTEFGDVLKVSLKYQEKIVSEIEINYFETLPIASSMCILRNGLLFLASEAGDHQLYQFQSIGEEKEDVENAVYDDEIVAFFKPRPLKNLLLVDKLDNLCPLTGFQVHDLIQEETPQIYSTSGKGSKSSLRVLRHGLSINEIAVSDLRAHPTALWTVKKSARDPHDKYIVVSFVNGTLVLSIGDSVEEVSDAESGFLGSSPTLAVALLGEDSLVQVHPLGIRHILADRRVPEWKAPGKKTIVRAAVNQRQVVIALTGGEIHYFELDVTGNLAEVAHKELGYDVSCLEIAPIPEGRQRAKFLAIGDWDNKVRIFSLDPGNCLVNLSLQTLPSQPESLCIIEMFGNNSSSNSTNNEVLRGTLFLNIGLHDGVLLRTSLDPVSGELTDTRRRFLGSKPVKLFKVKTKSANGQVNSLSSNAMMALSSRSWLCYNHQSKFNMTPVSYVPLEFSSSFSSEQCPDGIVAISDTTLRVISFDRLGEKFNQKQYPLRYTPRSFVLHSQSGHMVIAESDHNAPSVDSVMKVDEDESVKKEEDSAEQSERPDEYKLTSVLPRPGYGSWASCIRLINPTDGTTADILELENNESAISSCMVKFNETGDEEFVIVGTAANMDIRNRSCDQGFLYLFRILSQPTFKLQLLHKTQIEDIPGAISGYQGRLLVGVGKLLRVYDLGKRKLLRKCETKLIPTFVKSIQVNGDRIIVGDLAESFHFLKYKRVENHFHIFADDKTPRWLTASTPLDLDTMAGGDKFGNIFIARLPSDLSEDIEDDPTGSRTRLTYASISAGASFKLDHLVQFHVGEMITGMTKASLVPGGNPSLLFATIFGGIGAMIPFVSREDVDFFSHLEMHLRQEKPPLCGREHIMFRSSYFPVKDVIDGDLCEQFATLEPAKQRAIAEELNRTPGEVMKKLEDIRNMVL